MVTREQFVNDASTTLNGAINNSTTSVTVTDGSVFPSTGNFRVLVDSEIMIVTARSTNTLTVTRGAEGTTAASHSDGVAILAIVTNGGMQDYLNEALGINHAQSGGNFTGTYPFRLLDINGNSITASDWSWVNQGLSTITDNSNGGLTIEIAEIAGNEKVLYKSKPSSPFTITAHVEWGGGVNMGSSGQRCGIGFRDGTTGEFTALAMEVGDRHTFINWNSHTSQAGTTTVNYASELYDSALWMRFEDDNTDIKAYWSQDGMFWHYFGESARTANVTNPDQVCMAFSDGGGGAGRYIHVNAFVEHT